MITNGFTYIAVLMFIAGGLLFLRRPGRMYPVRGLLSG